MTGPFPVLLFSKLRFGFDPGLAAISTLVLIVSIALGLYAERFSRRRKLNNSNKIAVLDDR